MQEARANPTTVMCPPLGIAYLGATLRAFGATVCVVDGLGEAPRRSSTIEGTNFVSFGLSPAEIVQRVPSDTAIIGVSCMFSEEWRIGREVIRALGKAFPATLLVAGGEHISALPNYVLSDCPELDFCIVGEGEETLLEVCSLVAGDQPVTQTIPGVVGRATEATHCGAHDGGSLRKRIRQIDRLPTPAWDLLPMENYFDRALPFGVNRGRCIPILASRGCPYQCTFCSSPDMWTTLWRAREPDAVLDEIGDGIERFGARNFDFFDLTAIVRKEWIREFCAKLIDRKYGITWQIPQGTRSEAIDGEISKLLYASGCRNISYAPESGSPAVLKRIKKRVKLDVMMSSMAGAIEAGLKVKCNFIVGLPDETPGEVRETMSFIAQLAKLGVHDINATPYCPYPGSSLFKTLVSEGAITLNQEYFDRLGDSDDVAFARSHCESMNRTQLGFWRWRLNTEFYLRSFAHHPSRVASTARNLKNGIQTTRLERAIAALIGQPASNKSEERLEG